MSSEKITSLNTPRRSRQVMTTLLAAAAIATLGGCANSTTTARCVDQNGNVLPDSACQNGSGSHAGVAAQPRWVYGGQGGDAIGSRATDYSTSPPSDGDISSPSGTVLRGGFGGEGEAHGGGEGGGHGGGE